MRATLVGNCDIGPCCALRRLCNHQSASAPSVANRLANNLYVQIKLMGNWSVAFQSIATAIWHKKKNQPDYVWAKVVYIALVAPGGSWNPMSGKEIRLGDSSSAWWYLGVSFCCWGAAETQQEETSALQFCGAAPGEGQFTRVGASLRETRYWTTTVQLVGQHPPPLPPPPACRYVCPCH